MFLPGSQRLDIGVIMIEFDCVVCGKHVRKRWAKNDTRVPKYCSLDCKATMQRTQKPVDREWLYQKYIVEGLDCTAIAKIVNRNSKRVWEWLRDYGIETRKRGAKSSPGTWSKERHPENGPLSEETKDKIRQACIRDGRVPYMKNGVHVWKGKYGSSHPTWRGGFTPERANVYGSIEWKEAVKVVWKRDEATCQRCGKHHNETINRGTFDIHHIARFEITELRCEPSNLVLLCETCHYWVHSRENVNKEFLR